MDDLLTAPLVGAAPTKNAVRVERVTFDSNGETLVGDLYLPAATGADALIPGIVVTGAWTTVKEQMAGRYAREMAARGFVALAFDFRNWGESDGAPRGLETPKTKIPDIRAAADFLSNRPETADGGVLALGICASSGYMVEASVGNSLFRSIALVAPWIHDADLVIETYGGEASVQKLVASSRLAAAKYAATGEQTIVPAAGPKGSDAVMQDAPYYVDPSRGAIPEWDNIFDVASWEDWLTYDAHPLADKIEQPFFMIHSDAAAIPDGARTFFADIASPKHQIWLKGVTQYDFYDQDVAVAKAADAVARHFRGQIGSSGLSPQDRLDIMQCVTDMGLLIDLRDWGGLRALFADQVEVDYVSLFGGDVTTTAADALIADWRDRIGGLDATQHLIANVSVSFEGEAATVRSHVRARHVLGEKLWIVGGIYTYTLMNSEKGWRISSLTLTRLYEEGDRSVLGAAG